MDDKKQIREGEFPYDEKGEGLGIMIDSVFDFSKPKGNQGGMIEPKNMVIVLEKQTQTTMLEHLVIGILFCGALGYVGYRLWNELRPSKSGCAKGCGCDKTSVGLSSKS
ncbi:MAG: hypothetical protein R2822_21725 [Spirosomataceae bacterium]